MKWAECQTAVVKTASDGSKEGLYKVIQLEH